MSWHRLIFNEESDSLPRLAAVANHGDRLGKRKRPVDWSEFPGDQQPVDWSELPSDVVAHISGSLASLLDFLNVCPSWERALRDEAGRLPTRKDQFSQTTLGLVINFAEKYAAK
ncbi:hypothetical protein E2562_026812 [Oryza meyeriana var. granulata]|uniref:F-box domain-containing protein n=1 Tax=Oryza meyeriana var. granulata TaxID=110450 RepID=A0A6G1CIU3_9ORYZ|nr:hypothetical protein E2562_026812 [Oryza meyeriana var. granulata]